MTIKCVPILYNVLIILVEGASSGQQRFYPGGETTAEVSAYAVVIRLHTLLMGHFIKKSLS